MSIWSDTVIKTTLGNLVQSRLNEQAKISFKAGYAEATKINIDRAAKCYENGRQAGIKEVVSTVNELGMVAVVAQVASLDKWQAKLKSWNISV